VSGGRTTILGMAQFVLGSEWENMSYADGTCRYYPAGTLHAVAPATRQAKAEPALMYAVCGTPVIVWKRETFDPTAPDAHVGCAARFLNQ
jgi:hypothetical protein